MNTDKCNLTSAGNMYRPASSIGPMVRLLINKKTCQNGSWAATMKMTAAAIMMGLANGHSDEYMSVQERR